jgi:hypothetical protein
VDNDVVEKRQGSASRRGGLRRKADRDAFAAQMRAVAWQAASVAWDECAGAAGLADEAFAELLDRNPYRRVGD